MPTNPSNWNQGQPVSASQLDTDLYTYSPGNNHFPNGLLFHATPPMVMSNARAVIPGGQTSSTAGVFKNMESVAAWRAAIDNSCLFGAGGDLMGTGAAGHFAVTTQGSQGAAGVPGGFYLTWAVTAFAATTNTGGSGAAIFNNGSLATVGGLQRSSTTRDNAAYVLDVITGLPLPSVVSPGGFCADVSAASFAYAFNAADYTSETCHFGALWAGPTSGGATVPAALPVPTSGYTNASVITAAGLNGNGLAAPLAFLNNPPLLKAQAALTTSISSAAPTLVPITAVQIDSWSKFNTGTGKYTVPVTGVYLVHVSICGPAVTTGNLQAGVQIGLNGGGTLNLFGPAYQGAGNGNTKPQMIRLLDLQANDTVEALAQTTNTQNLGSAQATRMVIRFMAAQAGSNGSVAFTPPDTKFRWQAGTPASAMAALFNTHLSNDLNFLISRPYLMAYQSTIQTALGNNAFRVITMNNLGGRVHASAGDNYGGWTSGAANKYTAVVPGWYLAVGSYIQALPSATPAHLIAATGYFQSGGANQGAAPQQWGQHVQTTSSILLPGAETIGLFYLRAGDFLQPQYQQQDGGATFNTGSGTGLESNFGCVWVSE